MWKATEVEMEFRAALVAESRRNGKADVLSIARQFNLSNDVVSYRERYYNNSVAIEDGRVYDIITSFYDANILLITLNAITNEGHEYTIDDSKTLQTIDTLIAYIHTYMPLHKKGATLSTSPTLYFSLFILVTGLYMLVVFFTFLLCIVVHYSKQKKESPVELTGDQTFSDEPTSAVDDTATV